MKTPAPADLQRWSEELARNPASLAFLPLARAYRRLSRRDLALKLTLRGLEAHPANVEAHALLALLYLEEGERAQAADEWSIVLRLKPGNFEALRGMGFRYLEQNDIPSARQHLERAALIRPDDTAVQEALRLLRQREAAVRAQTPEVPVSPPAQTRATYATEPAEAEAEPWAPFDEPVAVKPAASAPEPVEKAAAPAAAATAISDDNPEHAFDDLLRSTHVLGALLLDARGLVLAGSFKQRAHADDVGAILGAAVDEAIRTVEYLALGNWEGLIMECGAAVLHVRPVAGQGIILLAAAPDAPMGWVLRTAAGLAERAARLLEVPA
jgi:tetratricopeptide (TPR) repeat protein